MYSCVHITVTLWKKETLYSFCKNNCDKDKSLLLLFIVFTPPEKAFIRNIALALTCHPRMGTWTLLHLSIKKEMQLPQLSELDCTEDPHLDSWATAFLSHGKQLAENKFVSPFIILCSSSALFLIFPLAEELSSWRNQKCLSLHWTTEWGENHCSMRKSSSFCFLFYFLDTKPETAIITTLALLVEKLD